MTVYVDDMRLLVRDARSGRTRWGRWSNLLADDTAELAAFAARVGLNPEWVRAPGTASEHFGVVEGLRRRALAAGAVPISYPSGTGNLIATKRLQASTRAAALRGWYVFPLRSGTKVPAVRDWEHAATTDPAQIGRMWAVRLHGARPEVLAPCNAGIACGPSGLVVVDLDTARPDQDRVGRLRDADVASGADVLAVLADQAGQQLPDTFTVATPSGGRHLYFTAPADVRLGNRAGHPGPMIDIRGRGGCVVAAGSQLNTGLSIDYALTEPTGAGYHLVDDRPGVELPGWLTAAILADRHHGPHRAVDGRADSLSAAPVPVHGVGYGAAALRGEADRVRSAPVGQRNHTLNAAAYSLGQLIAVGAVDQVRAVEALTDAAQAAGLATAEIASTIESGLTAGTENPRSRPQRAKRPEPQAHYLPPRSGDE